MPSKLLALAVALYVIFILGKAVYRNWQSVKRIEGLQNEIARIKAKNQNLDNLILYYQTKSFKEIEARRKLGLKFPDEKVIAVPASPEEQTEDDLDRISGKSEKEEIAPNYSKWWRFFFH